MIPQGPDVSFDRPTTSTDVMAVDRHQQTKQTTVSSPHKAPSTPLDVAVQNLHVTVPHTTGPGAAMTRDTTSFRPLDCQEGTSSSMKSTDLVLPSPSRITRRNKAQRDGPWPLIKRYERDDDSLMDFPSSKRFKLPSSSVLSLTMRPTFLVRKTKTLDSKRHRQVTPPLEDEEYCDYSAMVAYSSRTSPTIQSTPRKHQRNCYVQSSPPRLSPSSAVYEGPGPYPSSVCMPLL